MAAGGGGRSARPIASPHDWQLGRSVLCMVPGGWTMHGRYHRSSAGPLPSMDQAPRVAAELDTANGGDGRRLRGLHPQRANRHRQVWQRRPRRGTGHCPPRHVRHPDQGTDDGAHVLAPGEHGGQCNKAIGERGAASSPCRYEDGPRGGCGFRQGLARLGTHTTTDAGPAVWLGRPTRRANGNHEPD